MEFDKEHKKALEILLDIASKSSKNYHKTSEVELDDSLLKALAIAEHAYYRILDVGEKKIKKIKNILGNTEYFDPNSIHLRIILYPTRKKVSLDMVNCSLRVLRTYQTLAKYYSKVEEFRKIRELEKILGE